MRPAWIRRCLTLGVSATAAFLALPGGVAAQSLTLAEAIDRALESHPALAAAAARVTAAEGGEAAARRSRLPSVTATAALTRHEEPMVVAPLHSLNLSSPPVFDRTLVQSQLGVQYTVFDGGATGSRIRAADAALEATDLGRASTEMGVLEETVTAYVGLATARTVLEAARAQVSALEAERARVERHLDAGSAARVELITAEAVLQEARAEEAGAAARVGLAERSLARSMGVSAAEVTTRTLAPVVTRPETSPATIGTSPVVRQAEEAVVMAEARSSEARAGRFPTVQAGAGLIDYGAWERSHVLEWRAGVEVAWPIFAGPRGASIRRANAEVTAARADLAAARMRTAQDVDQAATAVTAADARAEALAAAIAQWEEVTRIEALALEAGSGEQRDLLRAEAGLYQARAGYALARQDALTARLRLARAEGVLDREWINAWTESL
ncbi:MAG: TolC family protein [Gemmatimonadales bacterium]